MAQQNPLDLAKQGDPNALAALMNRSLKPKGVTAKVSRKDDCLRVMLESNEVPNQDSLTDFIRAGVLKLDVPGINTLQVFGKQIGDEIPTWSQKINLKTPPELVSQQPISATKSPRNQRTQNPISSSQNNISLATQTTSNNNSLANSGIDSASPVILLIGCFLIGLFLLAINPALPIFTALLALGPALLASEKGRNPLNWWCYGFLLFIVAIIHAAVTPAIPERVNVAKRQFWRGLRIAAIVLAVLCIFSYQFTEEGSPARVFLGIGALASIVMSWLTDKTWIINP